MAFLQIRDLNSSRHLDRKALAATYGGILDWVSTYRPNRSSNPYGISIGQLQVVNVKLINPVFNTLNQVAVIDVDASNNTGSVLDINSGLGQIGKSELLQSPLQG